MAKDPAFLFYYQDFLVGTDHLSNESVGAYIRCLCHQAHKGELSPQHMKKICRKNKVFEDVGNKFISNGNGGLLNERLNKEVARRKDYCESRRKNKTGGR